MVSGSLSGGAALDRGACPLYDGGAVLGAERDAHAESKFNELMSQAAEQRNHAEAGTLD